MKYCSTKGHTRWPRFVSAPALVACLGLCPATALAQQSTPAPIEPLPTPAAPAVATEGQAVAPVASQPEIVPLPTQESAVSAAAPVAEEGEDEAAEALAAELTADAEQAAADEEAEALAALLGGDDEDSDLGTEEYGLKFYGFADFTYLGAFFGPKYGDQVTAYPGFSVGRLNLYMAGELGEGWRTLSEVRFTYLPNGAPPGNAGPFATERIDQTVGDYADLGRPQEAGGIIIERAWLEKTVEPWLNIRMGQYLTPYGIWNVDHGSPVILAMRRPFIISQAIFPERLVGIQLHGTGSTGALSYGYNLHLSNGRGPIPYLEWDKNKAIGWRLHGSYDTKVGLFQFGTSGYVGDYTDRTAELDPVTFAINRPITEHYTEQSTAFDLKWTYGGAMAQAELLIHDRMFPDERRQFNAPFVPGAPGTFQPDERKKGYYGIAGYRFDWMGVMPWGGWSVFDIGGPGTLEFIPRKVDELFLGLNVRPHPRVVLKASYTRVMWRTKGRPYPNLETGNYLDLQTAWSF